MGRPGSRAGSGRPPRAPRATAPKHFYGASLPKRSGHRLMGESPPSHNVGWLMGATPPDSNGLLGTSPGSFMRR